MEDGIDPLDWFMQQQEESIAAAPVASTGSARIRICAMTGGVLAEFELDQTSTIFGVKEQLYEKVGVPVFEQRLVPMSGGGASVLSDNCRLDGISAGPEGWLELYMVRIDKYLALSWSADRTLRLWDLMTGTALHDFGGHVNQREPRGVRISPEWSRALSWSGGFDLHLFDLHRGTLLQLLTGHSAEVLGVDVDWAHSRALSWSADQTLRLWYLSSIMCEELKGHTSRILGVEVDWLFNRALSWNGDEVFLWSLERGKPLHVIQDLCKLRLCSVDPMWLRALLGVDGCSLQLWDWSRGGVLAPISLPGFLARIPNVDVDWLLMRGILWDTEGGKLQMWDEADMSLSASSSYTVLGMFLLEVDWARSRAVSWSVNQNLLWPQLWEMGHGGGSLSPGQEGTGCVCRVGTGIQVQMDWDRSRAISWSDGCMKLMLWDLECGIVAHELKGHGATVQGLQVDWADDRALSWSSDDRILLLWDLTSGKPIHRMLRDPIGSFGVQANWERNSMLCWTAERWGNDNYAVELWDLDAGELVASLSGHEDVIRGASMVHRKAEARAAPAADISLCKSLGSTTGDYLLASYVDGHLDDAIDQYYKLLCHMPMGPAMERVRDGKPRASGDPNIFIGCGYVPTEDAPGWIRLLMCGSGCIAGAPMLPTPPVCTAIAMANADRVFVDNSGVPGIHTMALAKPSSSITSRGALPLPRPRDYKCDYACIQVGTQEALAILGSSAFYERVFQKAPFPVARFPSDFVPSQESVLEVFEDSLRAAVKEFQAAGATVVLATPLPLGEELAGRPLNSKHLCGSPFAVMTEIVDTVWRVADTEGCDVLPFHEICLHWLRGFEQEGRTMIPWTPQMWMARQRMMLAAQAQGTGVLWENVLPEPMRSVYSTDGIFFNERSAALYAALVHSWLDIQMKKSTRSPL